jgi:hypothetical protein
MKLTESVKHILKEQRHDEVLREAFLYDVRRLEEAREYSQTLLSEGVIAERIEDQYLLDEGIFDTLKALGKNVGGAALNKAKEVGGAAIAKAKAEWDKAKEQGNQDELARLQARLAQLTGKPVPTTTKRPSAPKRPAAPKRSAAPASGTTAKPPRLPTAAKGAMNKSKAQATKSIAANKTIVTQAASEVVSKMAKDDPKELARLQTLAQTDPTKLAAEYNKAIQQNSAEVKSELADTPETKAKPGLLGKIGAWAKKNPVKAGIGMAALGAIGTAAAIGSGGVLPLLTAALLGAGKGAAVGAIGGAVKGAIGQGMANKAAGGKFFGNLKQMGSAAMKSAGKGAAIGAAVGAGGAVAGKALAGVSKIASGLAGHAAADAPAPAAPTVSTADAAVSGTDSLASYYTDKLKQLGIKPADYDKYAKEFASSDDYTSNSTAGHADEFVDFLAAKTGKSRSQIDDILMPDGHRDATMLGRQLSILRRKHIDGHIDAVKSTMSDLSQKVDTASMADDYRDFVRNAKGEDMISPLKRFLMKNKGLSDDDAAKLAQEIKGYGSKANAFNSLVHGNRIGNDTLAKRFADAFKSDK